MSERTPASRIDFPLELHLRPSRLWRATVYSCHLGVLLLLGYCYWAEALPAGLLSFYLLALGVSFCHCLKENDSVMGLRFNPRGWQLLSSSAENPGQWLPVQLRGEQLVWSWLLVLRFKGGQRLVLFPDSAGPEGLHRLRVLLRVAGAQLTGADN